LAFALTNLKEGSDMENGLITRILAISLRGICRDLGAPAPLAVSDLYTAADSLIANLKREGFLIVRGGEDVLHESSRGDD